MVGFSGFFGGGAAEQSLKEDTLGIQQDRLALFRDQLKQKASDASMQRTLDEIKAGEQRLAAFDALAEKYGTPSMRAAADRQRALNQRLRVSLGQAPEAAQDVSALNQAIAQAPPPGKPFTLSPGQTRFGPTGEPVAQLDPAPTEGSAPGDVLRKIASSAVTMLNTTKDPDVVRELLSTIQAQQADPQVANGIGAIIRALPATSADIGKARGKAETARQGQISATLEDAGIPKEIAAVIPAGGATAAGFVSTTRFSPTELKAIRKGVGDAERVINNVEAIVPLIDDQTVGLVARINESLGATQQITGVKQVVNALGSLVGLGGEQAVQKAIRARAAFRQSIGPLARFISDKGGRLANEDRAFALQATAVLNSAASAEDAKAILSRLIGLARQVREDELDKLSTGRVSTEGSAPSGQESRVERNPDVPGGFVVKDAQGNVIRLINPVQ